jgi:hypothetical protein
MTKPTAADGRKSTPSPSRLPSSHQCHTDVSWEEEAITGLQCIWGTHLAISRDLFCGIDVEVARVQASHQGACWLDLQEPEEGTGRPPYAYA